MNTVEFLSLAESSFVVCFAFFSIAYVNCHNVEWSGKHTQTVIVSPNDRWDVKSTHTHIHMWTWEIKWLWWSLLLLCPTELAISASRRHDKHIHFNSQFIYGISIFSLHTPFTRLGCQNILICILQAGNKLLLFIMCVAFTNIFFIYWRMYVL